MNLLRTSLKNQVSKKCPSKSPFKPHLRAFLTMLSAQNDLNWVPRGVTDQWFPSSSRRWMPRGVHNASPKLWKNNFCLILYPFWPVFDQTHGNIGMRTFCFAMKLMPLPISSTDETSKLFPRTSLVCILKWYRCVYTETHPSIPRPSQPHKSKSSPFLQRCRSIVHLLNRTSINQL